MTARRRAGTILAVLALANVLGYAARNSLFAVYDDLRARYAMDDETLGLLATAFLVPHAIATLAFGWAGDRFDRRRVIAVGMVIAAVAGALGALAPGAPALLASRAAVGLGAAAIVPVANTILAQVFEGPAKASRMSIFNLGLLLGGVLGFAGGAALGFPAVLVVLAVPCAILAIVVTALPVPSHPGRIAAASLSWRRVRGLLSIRTLRWLMLSSTAMSFASGGYTAWLVDFLKHEKQMSEAAATSLLMATGVGAVAGIVVGGRVADRLAARTPAGRLWTIAIGMASALPCACAAIVMPAGPQLYVAGIALMFFFSWYHAPMAVSVDDLAPPEQVAAAQGMVIFTMHLVGTAPASWLVGRVSHATSLYVAMWVPTGALALAGLAMLAAVPSFGRDRRTRAITGA